MLVNDKGFVMGGTIKATLNQKKVITADYDDCLRINFGHGILNNRAIIDDILEEIEMYNTIVNNSSRISGILKTNGRLTQSVAEKLRIAWDKLYGKDGSNYGGTVVLEEGLEYQPIEKVNVSNSELSQSIEMIN